METLHLEQIVAAVAFSGVRIGGALLFPPFLGGEATPALVKAGFTIVLTALLYPVYGPAAIAVDAVGWVRVVAGEAVAGMMLGLALQFVFEAALMAGQIAGIQTGYSLVTLFDPQTQADTPVLAIFHQMVTILIFLQLNVHHWVLRGLAASFVYLPPGRALATLGATGGLLQAAGGIWLAGLQIAAPVVVATMMADLAMGFLGKASPQLPVVFVGLSVKNLLGLAVLVGTLAAWPHIFERHFVHALGLGERLLQTAR